MRRLTKRPRLQRSWQRQRPRRRKALAQEVKIMSRAVVDNILSGKYLIRAHVLGGGPRWNLVPAMVPMKWVD